ncbi:DUF1178 family protein [Paucibacter sp. B2R-40]|uniref:DUF1178 family protein n=1 Tax=Paucibacter sp. B2R-40 TaxID=2893554 RepID=UPI0021E441DB|nr:DUF1178 family protein [Paucibacter sp. B2R-40]MCV2355912.1 DUF1178 family protein [Paucibacter sp. B2R-40]
MLVLNLKCGQEHGFEAWFGSAADFESQLQRDLISCPICADIRISRMPSAPHLNVSHLRGKPVEPSTAKPSTPTSQSRHADSYGRILAAAATVLANTEDVGERFAEEARRIHYGETEAHGIRGQASMAEVAELVEEGISVLPVLLPPALKGPIQ